MIYHWGAEIGNFRDNHVNNVVPDVLAPRIARTSANMVLHDDVIKWKHFPRYWPFVWWIHRRPAQRPVTQSFDVFFDPHPHKRLSKQWGWWSETPSCPLWRHHNGLCRMNGSLSSMRNIFHYLRILSVQKQWPMQYFFIFPHNNSARELKSKDCILTNNVNVLYCQWLPNEFRESINNCNSWNGNKLTLIAMDLTPYNQTSQYARAWYVLWHKNPQWL